MISAPADLAGQNVRCPHCHRVVPAPAAHVPYASPALTPSPVPRPTTSVEPSALTTLYVTAVVAGVLGAACVYLVMFNELDESELVTITPLWFFPIVFGLYGFVSQRLLRRISAGHAATLSQAARLSVDVAGFWALPALFPFLVLRWRSSLLVSLTAAAFWAVLLWFFFSAVFPTL
ncbi:hypothetical protein [Streptomyces neyagawaensis]|uniref:hypothetical protein n=1 Tax=Streptomyces neyagawaensis TaxID=42238 RepID=UPI001F0A3C9C|nr:hypothetical protein [Streptomyces neyagawaensis]MCL6731860.1 hypothetical protein [Streptomyces neyagawaensis]MDE1682648.1 hypothetical protein [Streptomyces neyagawaensis]